MAFPRPSLSTLISQAQTEIAAYIGNIPLFSSVCNVLIVATAAMIDGLYSYVDYALEMSTPATALGEYAAMWGALVGITRIPATAASGGGITFAGTTGVTVPAATSISCAANQLVYTTNAQYVIGTSSPVSATCTTTGTGGNAPSGLPFSLLNPQSGVTTVASGAAFTGGSNVETDAALKTRYLARYATTPSGGNTQDYTNWALACAGVTRAWCLPNHIGTGAESGSVTVFTMFDNSESTYFGFPQGTAGNATAETRGTPATGDLLAVANAIYPLQPVTSYVYSAAPTPDNINITISGLGVTNSWSSGTWTSTPTTEETNILAAIQDMFVLKGTALGGTIQASVLNQAVLTALGTSTFTIVSPSGAITSTVSNLPVLGVLTLEP